MANAENLSLAALTRRVAKIERNEEKTALRIERVKDERCVLHPRDQRAIAKAIEDGSKDYIKALEQGFSRYLGVASSGMMRNLTEELRVFADRVGRSVFWQEEWMPLKAAAELLDTDPKRLDKLLSEEAHTIRTYTYRLGVKFLRTAEVRAYFQYGDIRESVKGTSRGRVVDQRAAMLDRLTPEVLALHTDELEEFLRCSFGMDSIYYDRLAEYEQAGHPYPLHALYLDRLDYYGSHEGIERCSRAKVKDHAPAPFVKIAN